MIARERLPEQPGHPPLQEAQGFDYAALDCETPIVVQHSPTQLNPHPRNEAIYGEEDITELMERIRESNWVKPLVCTSTGTIISGHRRWKAAIELRLKTVPVEVREFSDELAELEALLLENANRLKTTEQKVREAEAWKEVETYKAKIRQIVLAGTRPNSNLNLQENFPEGHKGQARDAVANRVGLGSGRNYEKAAKVITFLDEEASLGHLEVAKVLRKVLNEQSVDAAHMLVKKPPQERHAIANLIINGDAKTTKQAERMVRKDRSVEFIAPTPAKTLSLQPAPSPPDYSSAPTDIPKQGVFDLDRSVVAQATSGGSSVAEPQVSVDLNGDDVDDATQSDEELPGKVSYKPAEEIVEVEDNNFNFNSNRHPNPLGSGTSVASSAGRNHPDTTDVSDFKSTNLPQTKADREISEICNVLSNIFITVQHLSNEQKDEVFERVADYIRTENLGGVVVRFMHQYELAELCHKCFCAMHENTFSRLEVEQIKLSGLSDEALKFLNEETSQLLKERYLFRQ